MDDFAALDDSDAAADKEAGTSETDGPSLLERASEVRRFLEELDPVIAKLASDASAGKPLDADEIKAAMLDLDQHLVEIGEVVDAVEDLDD